ncbi:hypothetical protein ACFS2C_23440 [Prauserella oleivorans]|uniref:MinD-like ATPase involved in chromosome partitioning or flagellar assembly n=1 Tax=Prauserella oleivorans TaxID=1478153 RepID=A0ABW5WEG3_9PSEU
MAVIALMSAKAAPGVTTAVAALAWVWPTEVLLADCDPAGGDLAAGWLGRWLLAGQLRADRGVLSFATETRHERGGSCGSLDGHAQPVAVAPHIRLLAGLASPAQNASVGAAGWHRLAQALTTTGPARDVLVDLGRYSPATPHALLQAADLVLLAVRPHARHVLAARPALAELARQLEPDRLGLAVCATTAAGSRDVRNALGFAVGLELPHDPRAAAVLSDGEYGGLPAARALLLRAARRTALRLHRTLNLRPSPPSAPVPRVPIVTGGRP